MKILCIAVTSLFFITGLRPAIAADRYAQLPFLEYPERAKAERAQGTVTMDVRIDRAGQIMEIIIRSNDPDLNPDLVKAATRHIDSVQFSTAEPNQPGDDTIPFTYIFQFDPWMNGTTSDMNYDKKKHVITITAAPPPGKVSSSDQKTASPDKADK